MSELETFMDDITRYVHVYLPKTKDRTLLALQHYVGSVQNQLSANVKRL